MTLSTKALLDATAAEFVAGLAIALIDGKHVVVAKNSPEGVVLTAEGLILANSLHPLDRDAEGSAGGSHKGRRNKKPAGAQTEAAPDEPAVEAEAPADDAVDHSLEFDEQLELEDNAG